MDNQGTKWRRNIVENFNGLSRVHERYRQTRSRRQTDGRQHIANASLKTQISIKSWKWSVCEIDIMWRTSFAPVCSLTGRSRPRVYNSVIWRFYCLIHNKCWPEGYTDGFYVQRWPHASAGIGIFISVTASGIRLQLLQSTDTLVGT